MNYFFRTLLWIGFCTTMQIPATAVEAAKPKVIIRVTLGSPPPSCDRFGICRLEVLPGWMRTLPGEAIAECMADESGRHISISIDTRSNIDATTLERFFGSGVFITEAEVTLSADVVRALQIKPDARIPAGKWEVIRDAGMLTFTVDVK